MDTPEYDELLRTLVQIARQQQTTLTRHEAWQVQVERLLTRHDELVHRHEATQERLTGAIERIDATLARQELTHARIETLLARILHAEPNGREA